MKHRVFCVIMSILMILTCTACGSSKPKPEATLRKYVAAYNHNDKDAMIECYEPSVQELYAKAAAAGDAIKAVPGLGALIGKVGELAAEEAEANRPKLSIKIKGSERIDEEHVRLTAEYTYTYHKKEGKKSKVEKDTETKDVDMVNIDGTWYIAAPVDLNKVNEGLSGLTSGLGEIGSGLAPAFSDAAGVLGSAFSGIGSAISGWQQNQQTGTTSSGKSEFSFTHSTPDDGLCAEILKQVEKGKYEVSLNGERDFSAVHHAIAAIRAGYPDLFWVQGYNIRSDSTKTTITFSKLENYSETELAVMQKTLESAAKLILSQMPAGLSEYDKALWVHDYLVDHCEYDSKGAELDGTHLCHTAFGCLITRKAVCEGYARAFQYLTLALGLKSGVVSGDASGSHAWNYISVGGKEYWADVTWDDPVMNDSTDTDNKKHTYFLLDDAHMLRSRTVDSDNYYVPDCTAMDMNYFVQNGTYFTEYNAQTVLDTLSAVYVPDTRIEMMFADAAAYTAAEQDLIGNNNLRLLPAIGSAPYTYSTDDDMYVISFRKN